MAEDLDNLYTALKNADAAGDVEAAKRIALYIKSIPADKSGRRSPIKAMAIDPTSGMSGWERFVAGYGKAGADIARGAGKLGRDVAELVPGGERAANVIGLPTVESITEERTRDAPLMGTTGGMFGNIAGNVAAAVPTAFIPGANTMVGAGAIGTGYGALQPAANWSERGTNALMSGVGSAGVTGAARLLPAAYRAFISPFTQGGQEDIALNALSRFAKDPSTIKNAMVGELIPGSKPSLAEVTGDPGIAQLQRAAQAKSPEVASLFADAKTARLQARKDALLDIAGSHDDRLFFETAREQTAQRLYGDAFKASVNPKAAEKMQPEIADLLNRPSIKSARKEAIDIALEEGKTLTEGDVAGQGSIKGMHYMKKALDSQISKAKASGDNNAVRLLMNTQDKLVGVMQRLSPKYAQAMAEYQAASKPINTMDVGKFLYDKLVPAASDVGAERLTPQAFIKALKDGDKMAQQATGFKGAKLQDILTTDQLNTVINLAKDLGREIGAVERGKVSGSPTAQYQAGANMLRQVFGPLGLPESWVEKTIGETLASWGTKFPFNVAEGKIQNKLAEMLVNPQEAQSAYARQAASRVGRVPQITNALTRFALPPAAVSAGTMYGTGQ